MPKFNVEIEVTDKYFKPGDCYGNCPFLIRETYYNEDDGYDDFVYCVFDKQNDSSGCPLRKIKKKSPKDNKHRQAIIRAEKLKKEVRY